MSMIKGDAARAYRCARYVEAKYRRNGYRVQTLIDANTRGVAVQVCNSPGGFLGGLKKLVGLKTCATLRIVPCGDCLNVDVGEGEWASKSGAILFGTFVAFGFVAITGSIGAVKQRNLLIHIKDDAMSFFASDGQTVLPLADKASLKEHVA